MTFLRKLLQVSRGKHLADQDYFVHESSYVDAGVKIGKGTKIWHFSHVQSGSVIGEECILGQNVNIGNNVQIVLRNCEASNPCVLTYTFSSAVWNDPDVEIDLSLADRTARITEIDAITGLFTLE